MTSTRLNNNLAQTQWNSKFLKDYVAASGFKKYMGKSETNIIRIVEDLLKKAGETVIIPLVGQLRGAGVAGGATLVGQEEAINQFADKLTVQYFRHGVRLTEDQEYRTDLDMANAGRVTLKDWSQKKLRDDLVAALQSIIVTGPADANGFTIDTGVAYGTASAGNKNAYLVANTDRIMVGNNSAAYKTTGAGNWANTLATLTTANDKISAATLHRAKAMAAQTGITSSFGVNPYSVDDDSGETTFVYFAGPEQFADLQNDTEIQANLRYAAQTGMDNPLFKSGDLWLEGIIIRKIPAIGLVGNVGASSATVARGFLCGQNALTIAYAAMPTPITDVTDYGFSKGIGIKECRAVKKTSFGGVNYGVIEVLSTTTPLSF